MNASRSTLSDRELVLHIRRGETDTYGELVHRYQLSVFNVCFRLLGERRDAEDMTQEAFIRAYERLGMFDAERPFGPWIRRVAANLCLNRLNLKAMSHVELDEEFEEPAPHPGPEALLIAKQQAATVRAALLALPAHYRAVIELRHFQELEYDEMAKMLQLPMNTVKSHLFRARKMLAERLQND
ncbi:MAG TPA: sigma-70 family RNA polymerase sigma factor [Anaerolineales bacterium]|nr:sigma-70 family RNA polymerase sigma factor [Anaerolineales bacterium]